MPDQSSLSTQDSALSTSSAKYSTGLLHVAGHLFEQLAAACRATVQALEADATTVLQAVKPSAETTAQKIEAVLADDVEAEVNQELPAVESGAVKLADGAIVAAGAAIVAEAPAAAGVVAGVEAAAASATPGLVNQVIATAVKVVEKKP